MDFYRDGDSAFGSASWTAGAVLPFEGRALMAQADGLPTGALDVQQDGWLSPNNPVLVRGLAAILPLAWRGDPRTGHNLTTEDIAAFASEMQSAGMYWAGPWRVLDLEDRRVDSIGSYIAALRSVGATHVDCWTYSEKVGWRSCGPATQTRGPCP